MISPRNIHIVPTSFAVWQIEECSRALSKAGIDQIYFLQAARAAHHALYLLLVVARSGHSIEATLSSSGQKQWKAALVDGVLDSPVEIKAGMQKFSQLWEDSIKPDGLTHCGGESLALTDVKKAAINELTAIRNGIEHFVPGPGSFGIDDILNGIEAVIQISTWLLDHPSTSHLRSEVDRVRLAATSSDMENLYRQWGRSFSSK